MVAAYTLPKYARLPATLATALQSVQMSATFQSIPGDAMQAVQGEVVETVTSAVSPLWRLTGVLPGGRR